jgi:hypothetical protein
MKRFIAASVVALTTMALAVPANAADTTTEFEVTAGVLSISAGGTADLGSASAGGGPISAQLGTVSVTDDRGALLGTWTASASSTDFTTGAATANETISNADVDYWSGAATSSSGTAVFTPGQVLDVNAQDLSVSRTAFSATGVVGTNSADWDPTLVVNTAADTVAGVYSGTVTHSVA